jgi:hypothetical protein
MYTKSPEFRVSRVTEIHDFIQIGSTGDGETVVGHHSIQGTKQVVWTGDQQPSNTVLDGLVKQIRDRGVPKSPLSDTLRTQARRTVGFLGWKTLQVDKIYW